MVFCALSVGTVAMPGHAGDLCFVPSDNGFLGTVSCTDALLYPMGWRGYSTTGSPCESNFNELTQCQGHGEEYVWSISSSATDPLQNTGPLQGFPSLYLWMNCALPGGSLAAEFGVDGSLPALAFTTANGFLNAGGATSLLLAVGACPAGPVVAGHFIVDATVTGTGPAVDARSFGRVKTLYRTDAR